MGTVNWSTPTDWQTVCRRAAGRRKYNALRTFKAHQRRQTLLELVRDLGGMERGFQAKIAAALHVHPSVISKDLKKILPLSKVCDGCGTFMPRYWWEE